MVSTGPIPDDEAPLTSLPPGRAALAHAITKLAHARISLKRTQEPLAEIKHLRAKNSMSEAAALRVEIQRLHAAHLNEVMTWATRGAGGPRPAAPRETLEAERRLAEISAEAAQASATIACAETGYIGAAESVRKATAERDAAVFVATAEACSGVMEELRQTIAAALASEARIRGLVHVLRRTGDGNAANEAAAYRAAEVVETRLAAIRGMTVSKLEAAPGERLLERLRSDPRANLE